MHLQSLIDALPSFSADEAMTQLLHEMLEHNRGCCFVVEKANLIISAPMSCHAVRLAVLTKLLDTVSKNGWLILRFKEELVTSDLDRLCSLLWPQAVRQLAVTEKESTRKRAAILLIEMYRSLTKDAEKRTFHHLHEWRLFLRACS